MMTIEEAKEIFINRAFIKVDGGSIYDPDKWRESVKVISDWLEQEPCEDCVSREKALTEINKKVLCTTQEAREIISALPSVYPKPKTGHWIPVSERLPEEETDVLICNKQGEIAISRGSKSTEIDDFIWYTSGWRFGKVIAWMPLPEPYMEVEDA